MKRTRPIVHDLAHAIYELNPTRIGGFEPGFDDAPRSIRQDCYDRARAAVTVLAGG